MAEADYSLGLEKFDDIIIRGGKGGETLAIALGKAGKKVALIEAGQIGGACINVACIPTKTLVASAKLVDMATHSENYGVVLAHAQSCFASAINRKHRVVQKMVDTHMDLFLNTHR